MKIGIHGEFKIDSIDKIIKNRGLDLGGEIQKFIDSEVIRKDDSYVPFDTGMLKGSALISTEIGSGEIVYNTPYAKRQYYENAGLGKEGMNAEDYSGLRGRYWFERMKTDHLDDIRRGVQKIVDRK